MNLARRNEAESGDWLVAEQQTAGRGRRGRSWDSPAGNLYASTVVRLFPGDPPAQTLSFVAAWSLWSAAGVASATLKWPNDIMIEDRKLAGILLERSEDLVVVGFGMNFISAPTLPDRATACVREYRSDGAELLDVFADLQLLFAENLRRWRTEGFESIRLLWQSEGPLPGAHLRVDLGNGTRVEGAYDGLNPDGALRLRLASGKVELVHAGEVQAS